MPKLTGDALLEHEERNASIRSAHQAGRTIHSLAREHVLSPQRISQIIGPRPDFHQCKGCPKMFPQKPAGRPALFCSTACRKRYHNRRSAVL